MNPSLALVLSFVLAASSCDEMAEQPRGGPTRPAPQGAIARDDPALAAELARRPAMTMALLRRGQERYRIYCTPCHDLAGYGQGVVPSRGFPHPPSFHDDRLRHAASSHFVDVITHGHGVMYSYADRVAPADRWAIAAYIRALQLSQDAPLEAVPEQERGRLAERPR
jgi:mono/diheme cytochrome c family protein